MAAFSERFTAAIRAQGNDGRGQELTLDGELLPLEVEPGLATALERLEPFGFGHAEPLFWVRGLRVGAKTRHVGDGHLKLDLQGDAGVALDAIAFGWADRVPLAAAIGQPIEVAAHVRRQDPRWGRGVQLVVMDLGAPESVSTPAGPVARERTEPA